MRILREFNLKPHHHIRLDSGFKNDCEIWLSFLDCENQPKLVTVVNQPMIDILGEELTSTEICFYSDASVAKHLGFGCLLNTNWLKGMWLDGFIEEKKT